MAKTTRVRTGAVAKVPTQNGDQNTVPSGSVDLTKIAGDVLALLIPTGSRIGYVGTTAPTGWVLASGRTVGNAASGATERAAEDTRILYRLLWNSYNDTQLPVSGGRGASADLDFDANKTITLPDYRGRVGVGKDDMGGTLANRITAAGAGINGATQGASGGTQTHTLTTAEMPAHSHGVSDPGHSHTVGTTSSYSNCNAPGTFLGGGVSSYGGPNNPMTGAIANASATGISITNNGGGGAHQNTQPSIIETVILKL